MCVRALIQQATRMRHIVTSFVAPLVPPYFSTLSHIRHDFRKKVTKHKIVFSFFSTIFVWNISHSKRNSARHCHTFENVFIWSTRLSRRILMKLESSQHIFETSSNTKFYQNPSSGTRVVGWGRTDMTKPQSLFAVLWKRLKTRGDLWCSSNYANRKTQVKKRKRLAH